MNGTTLADPAAPPTHHIDWCRCFRCADERAAQGRPPLAIRIGRRLFEAYSPARTASEKCEP